MSRHPLLSLLLLSLIGLPHSVVGAALDTEKPAPIQVGGSTDGIYDSSVTDVEIGIKLIFNELLASSDESFEIRIYDSETRVVDDLKTGKLQALFVSSLRFLDLEEQFHPTGRYVVQFGPSLKQRYLLLVRKADHITNLADLQGKKVTLANGHILGRRYLDVNLLRQGQPLTKDFFSEIHWVKEVNTAVVDLFFGKTDLAVVPEFSFQLACDLNPQITKSLVAIGTSEPMINLVVGLRYDFPQKRLDHIEPLLLNVEYSPRLQRLLDTLKITGILRLNDEMLEEVRALNAAYQTLSRRRP